MRCFYFGDSCVWFEDEEDCKVEQKQSSSNDEKSKISHSTKD